MTITSSVQEKDCHNSEGNVSEHYGALGLAIHVAPQDCHKIFEFSQLTPKLPPGNGPSPSAAAKWSLGLNSLKHHFTRSRDIGSWWQVNISAIN